MFQSAKWGSASPLSGLLGCWSMQVPPSHLEGKASFLDGIKAVCISGPARAQTSYPPAAPWLTPLQPHQFPCNSLSVPAAWSASVGQQVSSDATPPAWPSRFLQARFKCHFFCFLASLLVPVAVPLLVTCLSSPLPCECLQVARASSVSQGPALCMAHA